MELSSMIVSALVLGASAGIKGIAETSIIDAYNTLSNIIKNKYKENINLGLLEKSPDSASRQAVVKEDIISCGADKDSEILLAVSSLLDVVVKFRNQHPSLIGVSIDDVQAFNIRIKDVISEGSGVVIQRAKIKGDIQIEGVVTGKKKRK